MAENAINVMKPSCAPLAVDVLRRETISTGIHSERFLLKCVLGPYRGKVLFIHKGPHVCLVLANLTLDFLGGDYRCI